MKKRFEIRRLVNRPIEIISSLWDEPLNFFTGDLSPRGTYVFSELMPRPALVILLPSTSILSFASPKWIDTVAELSSILMPLNSVEVAMRSISLAISSNSLSIMLRWVDE